MPKEHPDHPPIPGGYRGPEPLQIDPYNRFVQQMAAVLYDFDYSRINCQDVVRELRRELRRLSSSSDPGLAVWQVINMYGAVVHEGLFKNEAELIARQHNLRIRDRSA